MSKLSDYLLVFIAPLLAFLTQFKFMIIALTLLTIINYITKYFEVAKKMKGTKYRFLKAFSDSKTLDLFCGKAIEFPAMLGSIALFEVYFIGGAYVDFLDGTITLSKLGLLLVGWRELTQINKNVENMTGNNTFALMESFLPEKLKLLITRKPRE